MSLYTIGHSTHSAETFVRLLRRHAITAVCDVRSTPRSKMHPHFDGPTLRETLRAKGIEYVFLGDELGARPRDRACYVDGRARYELISQTAAFARGIERVRRGAESFRVALMCAEQDPVTCHRTIMVCRHLADLEISHILPDGTLETHDEAMKRLVRMLGVRGTVDYDHRQIIEAAYGVQGAKICYADAAAAIAEPAMDTLL